MKKFGKRYVILIVIMIVFASVVLWVQSRSSVKRVIVDLSEIPLNVGEWQGEEVLVDKETKDILETEKVLMRKYINLKGEEIQLAIVYYKDSRVALHLPEGCYAGQGSHIVEKGVEKIPISGSEWFFTNKLILKGNKGNQIILYYFQTGTLCTNSYLSLRWQMIKNKLMGESNSGALVRFSISIGSDQTKNLEILKEFIAKLSPILNQYLI